MPVLASAPLRPPPPLRLAWRHLNYKRGSAAGLAVALILAFLPGIALFVAGLSDAADVKAVVRASDSVTVDRLDVADARSFEAFQRDAQEQVASNLGGWLTGASERGTAGPYRIASINGREPAAPAASTVVTGVYVSDLSTRVDVVQGVLSSPRLAGVEPTVTMAQATADRVGIRQTDVVCVSPESTQGPGPAPWCARLIGLWVPTSAANLPSNAQNQQLQVFAGRDEFFAMAGMRPAQSSASRQYRPQANAFAPQDASGVPERVRRLRASLGAAHVGTLRTSLDADLERYAASRRVIDFPIKLLTAALALLSVLLVGSLGRWYLDQRRSDLALLHARGWPQTRARRLVLSQFALIAVPSLAAGTVALLLGVRLAPSAAINLPAVVAVVCIPLVAAAAWLTWLAWRPSGQTELEPRAATASPTLSWRGRDVSGALVLPAAALLLLPRLVGSGGWLVMGTRLDLGPLLVSLAGLVLLVIGSRPVSTLAAAAIGRRRVDLEGTLAQWQLRRWWQRYSLTGFVIVFGFATATLGAVELAFVQLSQPPADRLGTGITISLAVGSSGVLLTALLAYALAFLFASRSRGDDYAALLVDGLPPPALRRSLGIEQHSVLAAALLVGVGLGLVLVWADALSLGLEAGQLSPLVPAAVGTAATVSLGLILGAAFSWAVRRRAVGFKLVEQLWRLR